MSFAPRTHGRMGVTYRTQQQREKQQDTDGEYPDFRRCKGILSDADCEILSSRGVRLNCHVTILSQWSAVIDQHFSSRESTSNSRTVIDLHHIEETELTELLRVIYPPNKPITEWNVWKLLPLGQQLQMAPLLSKCEEFLLTRGPSVKLLVTADEYQMDKLKKKQLTKLKHVSVRKMESDKQFTQLPPDVLNELLTNRMKILEERDKSNEEASNEKNKRCEVLARIFEDIKAAWLYQGANARVFRKDKLEQAEEDLFELLGTERPFHSSSNGSFTEDESIFNGQPTKAVYIKSERKGKQGNRKTTERRKQESVSTPEEALRKPKIKQQTQQKNGTNDAEQDTRYNDEQYSDEFDQDDNDDGGHSSQDEKSKTDADGNKADDSGSENQNVGEIGGTDEGQTEQAQDDNSDKVTNKDKNDNDDPGNTEAEDAPENGDVARSEGQETGHDDASSDASRKNSAVRETGQGENETGKQEEEKQPDEREAADVDDAAATASIDGDQKEDASQSNSEDQKAAAETTEKPNAEGDAKPAGEKETKETESEAKDEAKYDDDDFYGDDSFLSDKN